MALKSSLLPAYIIHIFSLISGVYLLPDIDMHKSIDNLASLNNAHLMGVFRGQSKSANEYQRKVAMLPNDWLHGIDTNKLHFCEEAIFDFDDNDDREENDFHFHYRNNNSSKSLDRVRVVPTTEPRCMFGEIESANGSNRRSKRDTRMTTMPKMITIPADKSKETISENSYIKVRLRICSMPGGEVLVFDQASRKVLSGFRNGGTGYHCNQWMEGSFERFISDSDKIQIEFKLPFADDYVVSEVKSLFLKSNNHTWRREGQRRLAFKAHQADDTPIFELDIFYDEIEFMYEEPGSFPGPEVLQPLGNKTQQYGPVLYQPNWVKTIVLDRRSQCDTIDDLENCHNKYYIGLTIEIKLLELDFDRGDYLLIGPGSSPEFWKNSRCQMIAQKIDESNAANHRIWINTDSAFIRLVTHNSLLAENLTEAFQFQWTPGNTNMTSNDEGDVSKLIKEASIQICLVGNECTYFKTVQMLFVDEAVHIFNKHLIYNEKSITTLINKNSLKIFDIEPITHTRGHFTEQFCQFNLAIASPYDSEYPLVSADIVYEMFFGSSSTRRMIHSKLLVNNCVFQRISWVTVLIPIVIILLLSITTVVLFWRLQSRLLRKGKFDSSGRNKEQNQPLHTEEDSMQY